ncbi:MAG: hypothetical protein ACJ763_11195 [Bdellovibrionia bacterium]
MMRRAITAGTVFTAFFTLSQFNAGHAAVQSDSAKLRHHAQAKVKKVQSSSPSLTESERSSLRFRLENIWNEVDVTVRNSNADKKDVQRQEREFKALQVFTKIPLATASATKPSAVNADIKKSLQRFGLKLNESKLLDSTKPDRPIPAVMPQDAQSFRFTEDQLAQKLRLELTLTGSKKQLQEWMDSWNAAIEPESQVKPAATPPTPYMEWDPAALTTLPEMLSENQWKVHVLAYYFRDIQYPKLQPQDPLQILPDWAKKNPEQFKAQEPLLWGLVEKTQATTPKALPGYETKARFQLNAARMTFFTSKVVRFE